MKPKSNAWMRAVIVASFMGIMVVFRKMFDKKKV